MFNLPALSHNSELTSYLDQVHKFPYLTKDEEYSYAKKWAEKGDVSAAHALVTSHLRLVTKIATKYKGYGLNMLDLISEGNLGLMHAVKKFNPANGARLCTYAMWWINSYIHDYILKSWSLVKIGTTAAQKKLFFNLRSIKNKIIKHDKASLSPEEISEISNELDVSKEDVVEMNMRMSAHDKSLHDPIAGQDNESVELIDFIPGSTSHENIFANNDEFNYRQKLFYEAYDQLNEREKDILYARRLQDKTVTLEDLSIKYNLSRERIRQIELKAIDKIKNIVQEKV